ncbi:hypothetical protein CTEN210_00099 [Chaetoceros tenuissimus]|uniref:Uncharacterized protein n=1 Tax=Chaetoceros tenuissimus TaxID=426638 RepID=A0AAD3CF38_9STRA|nr:hypothetical protein CTEN210_00099 [Chaetoceros tenuissimus]
MGCCVSTENCRVGTAAVKGDQPEEEVIVRARSIKVYDLSGNSKHVYNDEEEIDVTAKSKDSPPPSTIKIADEGSRPPSAMKVGRGSLKSSIISNISNDSSKQVKFDEEINADPSQLQADAANRRASMDSARSVRSIESHVDRISSAKELSRALNLKNRPGLGQKNASTYSLSTKEFFAGETEEEAKARRNVYRQESDIVRGTMLQDKSLYDLQNQILDWESKHRINKDIAEMESLFARTSMIKDPARQSLMIEKFLRRKEWMNSIIRLDPRNQIHTYFQEVARSGGPLEDPLVVAPISLMQGFRRASSFSVWRPTSIDAIQLMMRGEATGKGMDIKGKSAKKGFLSGLIPFIQIYENQHKEKAKLGLTSHGMTRIYFKSKTLRVKAAMELDRVINIMKNTPDLETYVKQQNELKGKSLNASLMRVSRVMQKGLQFVEEEGSPHRLDVDDYNLKYVDDCGFGIEVSERVFYEACVMCKDISRKGEMITGRPSEPNFQAMNFESIRNHKGDGPRPVVYQLDETDPLKPNTLVVAYEENETVTPVSSDFDCFTVATRGVVYDQKMPEEQVEFMKWMVSSIGEILDTPKEGETWTSRWFEILDNTHKRGEKLAKVPRFGFGDPKSYQMMEGAVTRFVYNKNGAVRHGAECFNYKFPQEIDDELLVIMDSGFDGTNRLFKYMKPEELQELMLEKIDDGFIFPINPKWIVADKGWKRVYDKLMSSKNANTQISLETWFPKDSGIRELIEEIHMKHPQGYSTTMDTPKLEGTEALDLMRQQLKRQKVLRKAIVKFKSYYQMSH